MPEATSLRRRALSWFGIVGGSLTVATALAAYIDLAPWVAAVLRAWIEGLHVVAGWLLFFLPRISRLDTAIGSLAFFLSFNAYLASRTPSPKRGLRWAPVALLLVVVLFLNIIETRIDKLGSRDEATSVLIGGFGVHVQDWLARLSGSYGAWLVRNAPEALASALAVFMLGAPLLAPLLLPLAVLAAVLLALRIAQGRCLNWRAYMMRLLRMVAGAAVVAVLSILSGFAAAFLPPGLQGWMALRTG